MNNICKIGIVALVLLSLVPPSLAGVPGIIEPKPIIQEDETPIWELDPESEIRVIITLKETATDDRIQDVQKKIGNFKVESKGWNKVYPNGFAATIKKKQFYQLLDDSSIDRVDIDKKMTTHLDTANYWSGATKARQPSPTGFNVTGDRDEKPHNYTKTDVVIAILDTGIDPKHKDLSGVDNGGTEKIIGWADVVNGRLDPYDDHGHGTHVASIAAGEGDEDPSYSGVAPGAALVGVKVLTSGGWGYESWVISGVNWVVNTKDTFGTKIISMSLGSTGSSDGKSVSSVALTNAINNGITVILSAGNNGPQKYTIGSPAATEKAITIGAMADVGYLLKAIPASTGQLDSPSPKNRNTNRVESGPILPLGDNGFYLAPFSSRGPAAPTATSSSGNIKPDVVAPGVQIMAAKSIYPNTGDYHGGYIEYSGTSMAAPFVAGTAALMLDANYTLTPAGIKNMIRSTAEDYGVTGCDIDYGCGRIRSYRAVKYAKTGSTSSTGDQSVPTHTRIVSLINDTTWEKKYAVGISDTNYPFASTLITRDWSGPTPGSYIGMYVKDPLNSNIGSSWTYNRQNTLAIETDYIGVYNLNVSKYWYGGSGAYTLDISER